MDEAGRVDPMEEGTGSSSVHAWERMTPWWNGAYAVVLGGLTLWAVVALHNDVARLIPLIGLYAVLGALYFQFMARNCAPARATVYLAVAASLFIVAAFLFPSSGFLLFMLIPQCFMILERRNAVAATIGLMVVVVGANIEYSGADLGTVVSATTFGVLGVALSLLLGTYITRIIEQSAQRAELIEELSRTRSELAEVNRNAGALAEREHLAREIHDVLAQGFTSVVMLLQAAQAAMDRGDMEAVRRSLDLAEPAARDGLAEARALIAALAPPHLQAAPLPDALRRVAEDLGSRFGFTAGFEVVGQPAPLPPNTEIVLLRAAQETLANVGRHSGARSARVRLVYEEKSVTVVVDDDGSGFGPDTGDGFGLGQLRSRAASVGGCAEVRSALARGTTVTVVVPRDPERAELPRERAIP